MITYKFIYNRKNKLKKDGTALVQLEIYKKRDRRFISTNVYVEPQYWDKKNSRIYKTHSRADEFNMILHDCVTSAKSELERA